MQINRTVAEYQGVDGAAFADIVAAARPAVLRGVVDGWPAVAKARHSPEAICAYLMECDSGSPVDALLAPASEQGRLFYRPDMDGFNFVRRQLPICAVIEQLARYSQFEQPPAVAVQSALIDACLPRFVQDHPLALLDAAIRPRIWIGNHITTPAHFDQSDNLACVVAGQRRFTLFPPDQVANLYIGPLDFAPTPTPISMVDFAAPDLARFPRFAQALEHALVVDLAPGDAIYIPTLWWHHVQSIGVLNILVNYWWTASPVQIPGPMEAMIAAMAAMRAMTPDQRAAWASMFQHYVFDASVDPAAHIPAHRQGVLTKVRPV